MNIQELEKLNELKEKGILTEEEFNLKKKEIKYLKMIKMSLLPMAII